MTLYRPPIEERGPELAALTVLAALVYCWGTLVTDDHAPSWLAPLLARSFSNTALWRANARPPQFIN